ncbi:MAG: hypothetical protein LBI42_11200 [Chitinispirillales bacterium]|nr:hypothetical protein [Chitinispirillales bacterium]
MNPANTLLENVDDFQLIIYHLTVVHILGEYLRTIVFGSRRQNQTIPIAEAVSLLNGIN